MKLFGINATPVREDSNHYYEKYIHTPNKKSSTEILFRINDYVNFKSKYGFRKFKHYELVVKWFNCFEEKCYLRKIISNEVFTDTVACDFVLLDFEDEVKSAIDKMNIKKA